MEKSAGVGTKRPVSDCSLDQPDPKRVHTTANEDCLLSRPPCILPETQPTTTNTCDAPSPAQSVFSSPFSESYPLDEPEARDSVESENNTDGPCVYEHFLDLVPPFQGLNKNSGTIPAETCQRIHDLRQSERQFMPKCDYMARQPEINEQMRAILVDWLVEVSDEYKLAAGTLFLTVSIVDRFLDRVQIPRDKLQLVGVAAMLIAAKLRKPSPVIEDFVYITDNTYTADQITKMETIILNDLSFKVIAPTTSTFLVPFQIVGKVDEEVRHLSCYLTELCLLEYVFVKYRPSVIAASAIALARHTVDVTAWDTTLEKFSGISLADLGDCMEDMLAVFTDSSTSQLQALREKYSAANPFLCVAHIPPPESPPFS